MISKANSSKVSFFHLLQGISPLTFENYMELALYHPDYGYYARGNVPGKEGDYITAPCINKAFGATLALQVLEVYEILGKSKDFAIVEMGAGAGYLAYDMLSYLKSKGFDFPYYIVEPFLPLKAIQEERLSDFKDKILWIDSLEKLPLFEGVFVANELFDALPVHLVEKREGDLWEIWVEFTEEEVREFLGELSETEVLSRVYPYFSAWQEGYRTEICTKAWDIYEKLSQKLQRGLMLILDYGYPRGDLYHPQRSRGTLLCYYRQRVVENPYFKPGHIDITAHVDFTYLRELGERFGFINLGFTGQGSYLVSLGIDRVFQEITNGSQREKEALKMLLLPEGLGQTHWVLAQGRFYGKNPASKMKGFAFSNRIRLLYS